MDCHERALSLDDIAWFAKTPAQTFRNWLHRELLGPLRVGAGSGKRRSFSFGEALKIALIAELVHLGQPPSVLKEKALARAVDELGRHIFEALVAGNQEALATLKTMCHLRLRHDWLQSKILWSFVDNPAPPDAFTDAPYLALDLYTLVVRLTYYVCRVRGLDLPAIVREEAEKFNASLPVGPGIPLEFTG